MYTADLSVTRDIDPAITSALVHFGTTQQENYPTGGMQHAHKAALGLIGSTINRYPGGVPKFRTSSQFADQAKDAQAWAGKLVSGIGVKNVSEEQIRVIQALHDLGKAPDPDTAAKKSADQLRHNVLFLAAMPSILCAMAANAKGVQDPNQRQACQTAALQSATTLALANLGMSKINPAIMHSHPLGNHWKKFEDQVISRAQPTFFMVGAGADSCRLVPQLLVAQQQVIAKHLPKQAEATGKFIRRLAEAQGVDIGGHSPAG